MPRAEASVQLDMAPRHVDMLRALLAEHLANAEAWAFGSRVNGGSHEGSDLDLVVRSTASPEQLVEGVERLRAALQDSALPMIVELHDWSGLPPDFRGEIERRHLQIWPA